IVIWRKAQAGWLLRNIDCDRIARHQTNSKFEHDWLDTSWTWISSLTLINIDNRIWNSNKHNETFERKRISADVASSYARRHFANINK
ncbi:MAG: hypothetical protein WB504_09740, partial [Pseudolabrys sp.]